MFNSMTDTKYILKKLSSGYFYMIRDKPMDKPMAKSMIIESPSSSCEANEEAMKLLRMENLSCELEKVSCMEKVVEGAELLQLTVEASKEVINKLAHTLVELITGM